MKSRWPAGAPAGRINLAVKRRCARRVRYYHRDRRARGIAVRVMTRPGVNVGQPIVV